MMTFRTFLASAAVLFASPVLAQTAPQPASVVPADKDALANNVANLIMPKGTFNQIFEKKLPEMANFVLDKKALDFVKLIEPYEKNKKSYDGMVKMVGNKTVLELMNENAPDPHWRERISIVMRVIGQEYAPLFDLMEPELRTNLAKTYARKFSAAQLTEMNSFLATPTGRAYSEMQMMQYYEPEVLLGYFNMGPKLMPMLEKYTKPDFGKSFENKLTAAMAHLPPMKTGPLAPRPKGAASESTVYLPDDSAGAVAEAASEAAAAPAWENPENWAPADKAAYDAATAKSDAASEELAKIYEAATANAKAKLKDKAK